jgi:hypothetical protein
MTTTYHGSCHCGAIRFAADLDLAAGTNRCNCTFCAKARLWFAFAVDDDFRLLQGAADLADYRHAAPGKEPFLHFHFCRRCGFRPFTAGGPLPMFGDKPFHAINLACLDDATIEDLTSGPLRHADGLHDNWGATAPEIRHL